MPALESDLFVTLRAGRRPRALSPHAKAARHAHGIHEHRVQLDVELLKVTHILSLSLAHRCTILHTKACRVWHTADVLRPKPSTRLASSTIEPVPF